MPTDDSERWAQTRARSAARRSRRHKLLVATIPSIDTSREMLRRVLEDYPNQWSDLVGRGRDDRLEMLVPHVFLRRTFLFADSGGPPPLARLIGRHGEALRLYLLLIFIAQLPFKHLFEAVAHQRTSVYRPSWPGLLGHAHLTQRQHELRLQRALNALSTHDLVALPRPGRHGRYRTFLPLDESGSRAAYRPPMPLKIQEEIIDDDALLPWLGAGRRKDLLLIPSDFFTSGWWLVLSPSEIATYLMLLDVRFQNHFSNLVFVRRSTRLDNYGISDEVYATHRELREFGLLKMRERQGRRRGRIQPKPGEDLFPLEFGVLRKRLQYSATASVMEALGTHSYAPHLAKPERSRRPSSRGMTLEEEMWERVYWEGPPEDPIDPLPDEELLAFPPDTPEWIELLTSIKRRSNEST